MEKDKIIIRNDQGEEKEYYKLIRFYSRETNKSYLVYTDMEKDENGKLKLYSSVIFDGKNGVEFLPVVDEYDLDIVGQAIIQARLELMGNE